MDKLQFLVLITFIAYTEDVDDQLARDALQHAAS